MVIEETTVIEETVDGEVTIGEGIVDGEAGAQGLPVSLASGHGQIVKCTTCSVHLL